MKFACIYDEMYSASVDDTYEKPKSLIHTRVQPIYTSLVYKYFGFNSRISVNQKKLCAKLQTLQMLCNSFFHFKV